MADLIAIGYRGDGVAPRAADTARRLADDDVFAPLVVATVSRGPDGRYRSAARARVTETARWETIRGLVALGVLAVSPVPGIAAAALVGGVRRRLRRIDAAFEDEVRAMLEPGTSALFLAVDRVTPDAALEPLSRYGGKVLKSSLSREAEHELGDALQRHGDPAVPPR